MLGRYLAQQYFGRTPKRYIRAFLLGCTEPDKNLTTYLKGSIRSQWLRGHNWESSQRYIQRIAERLERRKTFRLIDYYTLGKLVHYITDAFTFSHNTDFPGNLKIHRHYENKLQHYFLSYLENPRCDHFPVEAPLMDSIRHWHRRYRSVSTDICRDSRYCVSVTSTIMSVLLVGEPLPCV